MCPPAPSAWSLHCEEDTWASPWLRRLKPGWLSRTGRVPVWQALCHLVLGVLVPVRGRNPDTFALMVELPEEYTIETVPELASAVSLTLLKIQASNKSVLETHCVKQSQDCPG